MVDIVRDVTHTKAFEAELEQAKVRAEAAAAAKSAFLANMSHELRTPLTSIIGFARLLGDRAELTSDAKHYAQRISDASEALLAIINDVLDFSKLEAGQVTLERAPVSVQRLADETTGLVSIQAAARGLKLVTRLDPGVPEHVVGDIARIRQVLLNLLSNAVKFTRNRIRHGQGELEGGRGRRLGPAAPGRLRHRRRHRAGEGQAPVRAFLPGGRLDQPDARRHGPRPGDLQGHHRTHGRTHRRHHPPRQGLDLLVRTAARGRREPGRGPAHHCRRWCGLPAVCGSWWSTTPP